jgi:uncharacterized protein (TIGR03000 family)
MQPPKAAEPVGPPKQDGAAQAMMAPARLLVSLPEDARLTIQGDVTTSTSSQRLFVSPPLPMRRDYYYLLQAEAMRDGRKVTVTRQVLVRGGQESQVLLEFPVLRLTRQ